MKSSGSLRSEGFGRKRRWHSWGKSNTGWKEGDTVAWGEASAQVTGSLSAQVGLPGAQGVGGRQDEEEAAGQLLRLRREADRGQLMRRPSA